jgi:hypothetical protein
MNFSARQEAGKWRFGATGRSGAALAAATAVLCVLAMQPEVAQARRHTGFGFEDLFGTRPRPHRAMRAAKVPLPLPRPPEAPSREVEEARGEPEIPPATEAPAKPAAPVEQTSPATPAASGPPAAAAVSACRQTLTEDIAIAPSIPPVHGPGGCGGDDLVRLEAIVLRDKHRVSVTPPATLRCSMASSIADWVRNDIAPLTEKLGSEITSLDDLDSYDCRARNGIKGAPLSEHAKANALDVRGFSLADGREIGLTDRSQPRALREDVLHSVCARFMTVLGPDSDWYHEDHIHLDLMERRNNYKICQWDVLDPLPSVAPLAPAERPADAPRREVAKEEGTKEQVPAAEGDKAEEAKPAEAQEQQTASKPHRSTKLSGKAKGNQSEAR